MKPAGRVAAAAFLSLAASSAAFAGPQSLLPHSKDPLAPVQQLFDQSQYEAVIQKLPDAELLKLRRSDLRRAYDLLGLSYQNTGQPDRAIGIYQLAAQLFPKDLNLLTHLADMLHAEDLDDQAKPLYEQALRIHPNNAAANLGIAEIERSTGLLDQAQTHYEKCLAEIKTDPGIWRGYAEVLAGRRNFAKAAEAIQKSLEIDPGDSDSLRSLAVFQRRQNLKDTAYATLEKAIAAAAASSKYDELLPELSLQKASWLLEDGRLDESLDETQSVLYRFPQDPFGLWLRASIEIRRGDERTAKADLEAASAQSRQAPFVASVAQEMLKELQQ